MPLGDSSESCPLPCIWENQNKCFRKLVAQTITRQATLTHGQLVGLRELYHPDPLPPCVTLHGRIHFEAISVEEETQPLTDRWSGDCPDL